MYPRIGFDTPDQFGKFVLNIFTGCRMVKMTRLASQTGIFFHQMGFISLGGKAFGRRHA